jgi:CBS domain-containing protein
MQVRSIMTEDPACCTPSDSVARAASLMEEYDCGCIPVIESRDSMCVVGVITDRDIAVRGVRNGRSPNSEVGELMTMAPYCCSPDADVREVESIMADRQVRRVVVVDDGGCCLGIVAQADLARAAERGTDVTDEEVGRVLERISEPSRHQEWRL